MQDFVIENEMGIYRITSQGKVYSQSKLKIPLCTSGRQFSGQFMERLKPERELATRVNNRGYLSVCFNKTTYMVHKLVAKGFCENPENKLFVNHIDGDKLNNSYDNLEWCTVAENNAHARSTGLHKQAVGHKLNYLSKETKAKSLANLLDKTILTKEQVLYARENVQKRKRNNPYSITSMAKEFGVSICSLSDAICGNTFKNVK